MKHALPEAYSNDPCMLNSPSLGMLIMNNLS